ncbi:hypothetical protein GOP47_0003582 [Adiantum capillus-veneris]|uniref:Uncharacterized protein n=1 Tax=Adiantum capillus-veneris TaxID=13818 RepID=A0A9D4V5Z0_ADICA|nr:hypothetical protein GOP47_0003582 [Adiantum capillus-veneris]
MAGVSLADENVAALLARIGFTADQARDLRHDDIRALGLSPAESLLLRKAITNAQALYSKYFPLVGRVGCEWLEQDGSNKTLQGSCVLCGKGGLVVTVLHTVQPPNKRNARDVRVRVTLPNTRKGRFSFATKIVKIDKNIDLALLQPINPNPRLDDIDFFSEWAQAAPRIPSKVHLISYPSILDKEFPGRLLRGDRPSMHSGRVVHKEDFEAVGTYPCFGGCSGGLILCFDTDGTPGCGIHLGLVHETEELTSLNLPEVNEGLQQKGGFGHFFHGVANFIQGPKPTLYKRKKRSATYLVRIMKPPPQSPVDDGRVSSRRTLAKTIRRIVKSWEDYEAPKSSAEFDWFEMNYVESPEAYEKEKTSKKREASIVDDAALNEGKKAKRNATQPADEDDVKTPTLVDL